MTMRQASSCALGDAASSAAAPQPSKQAVAVIKDPYSCSSCWISHVEGLAMQQGLRQAAWLPLPRLHTSVHVSPTSQSQILYLLVGNSAGCVRCQQLQGPDAWCGHSLHVSPASHPLVPRLLQQDKGAGQGACQRRAASSQQRPQRARRVRRGRRSG